MSLWPTFQYGHVLISSVSNLILRFIVGNPSRSVLRFFLPSEWIGVVLMPCWWLESPQFVLAIRWPLRVKGVRTTEHHIRTDLKLNVKAPSSLPGRQSRCKRICSSAKWSSDLKQGLVSFFCFVLFLFLCFFLSLFFLPLKNETGQWTGSYNLCNICRLSPGS